MEVIPVYNLTILGSNPHWNWRMLRHIYVADRLALKNRNANKTKEIGVRMWRTAYPNSTGVSNMNLHFYTTGMIKTVAKEGKCLLISGEIYDILSKLLKTDDDASGEVQFLCQMFSGEKTSFR